MIEQRVIDALMTPRFEEWRSRGILDSVNAANLPRHKMGDCKFQDAANKVVEAFEAHAGFLSEQYLQGHVSGLPKLIRRRIAEEWGEPDGWTIHVNFVTHDAFSFDAQAFEIEDVNVTIDFTTYEATTDGVDIIAMLDSFRELVWQPLNNVRTPEPVRDWYREAVAPE